MSAAGIVEDPVLSRAEVVTARYRGEVVPSVPLRGCFAIRADAVHFG